MSGQRLAYRSGAPAVVSAKPAVYSRTELMVIEAARALRNGEVVFVGIGLPNLACNLAKRLHAPQLELIYESGVFGAAPERQALSIGDPCLVSGAAGVCSLPEIFLFYLQRGLIDVGFLGAAQIDLHGNINSTVIGEYERPTVRLPGSGGASEIAALARRVFLIGRQSRRSFVERVDFVTSPGHAAGERAAPGAARRGPERAFTDLASYEFNGTGEMRLRRLHPGVAFEDVEAATGWRLERPEVVDATPPPTAEELRLLREELDPHGYYLK